MEKYDFIVGVGGGSSLDVAKTASITAVNPGDVEDFIGVEKVEKKGLPLILVPTTAGTGSEVSRYIVLTKNHIKVIISSWNLVADLALVDPELTFTMPPKLTLGTGLDALSHAVEGIVSTRSNPLSDSIGCEAIRLIRGHLERAYYNGEDLEARAYMSLASTMAGVTLTIAGVVLGHSIAYTIAPRCREEYRHHGTTCGIALPYTIAYNMPVCVEKYARIAESLGIVDPRLTSREKAYKFLEWTVDFLEDFGIPLSLRKIGVREDEVPKMVSEVLTYYPRPNNPRVLDVESLEKLYYQMLEGEIPVLKR